MAHSEGLCELAMDTGFEVDPETARRSSAEWQDRDTTAPGKPPVKFTSILKVLPTSRASQPFAIKEIEIVV